MSVKNAAKISFKNAMSRINSQYGREPTLIEQVAMLDYLMDIIKIDIQGSSYAQALYAEHGYEYNYLLPQGTNDENGNKISSFTCEKKIMELSKDNTCLVSKIWKPQSLLSSICNIVKFGYIYHDVNQYTIFYPFWNMHITTNGGHHITCGYLKSEAVAESAIHDITRLFDHIYTDGATWYNTHTKEKISEVYDFRFAVLFEIGKLRNNLCIQNVVPGSVPRFSEYYERMDKVRSEYYSYCEIELLKEETDLLMSENKRLRNEIFNLKKSHR